MAKTLSATSTAPTHQSTPRPAGSSAGRHPEASSRPIVIAMDPMTAANHTVPVHMIRWTFCSGDMSSCRAGFDGLAGVDA